MMTRRIVFWVMMIAVTAGVALNTSLRVQAQEAQLEQIHQTIQKEQERIRVLTAEWHMLKAPARLEGLVGRHLKDMGRIVPEQMVTLADLPQMMDDAVQVANVESETVAPLRVAGAVASVPASAPASALVPVVAAVKSVPVKPAVVASVKPVKSVPKQDDVARLIARESVNGSEVMASAESVQRDSVRALIERDRDSGSKTLGVILASAARGGR